MSKVISPFSCVSIGLIAILTGANEAQAAGSAVVGSQATTFAFFGIFLAITLAVCAWAARQTSSTDEYLAASNSVTATQNGFAIAGDYMSAGAFLGLTGAIYASGLDGFFLAATYLASWPVVLFLVAEPLRRLGRYSLADVLAHKLNERPIRVLSAACSLTIICFYLVAQLVGAGELLGLLVGISYRAAVLGGGALMIVLAIFGGMRGATWVQIIKAVLMLISGAVIATLCLSRFGLDLGELLHRASGAHPSGQQILNIRGFARDGIATTSLAIGVLFGTAGLPHILMRFLTVRDERAARLSVFYATCLIGLFFIMLLPIGFGSISLLRDASRHLAPDGSVLGGTNMVAIHLAEIVGGSALMGFVTAVAFATILAVVCGLLIAGASAATNDLIAGLRGRPLDERSKLITVRFTAAILGVIAVVLAIAFEGQNVAYLIAMATSIAASANFPLLILAIYWPRLSTAGALAGGAFGLLSSVTLTVMGPTVWTKVLGLGLAPFPYDSPAILTVPAAFLVCFVVSILKRPVMDLASVDLVN
ncbi:cation/acetate symporter [Bradyrhizobium elkanii]|jgi:cation/acetate symporter